MVNSVSRWGEDVHCMYSTRVEGELQRQWQKRPGAKFLKSWHARLGMKAASDWMCAVKTQVMGMEMLGWEQRAEHTRIEWMFVVSDSVPLPRQTQVCQSDEDVDQIPHRGWKSASGLGSPEGLLFSWAEQRLVGSLIGYIVEISLLRRKKKRWSSVKTELFQWSCFGTNAFSSCSSRLSC